MQRKSFTRKAEPSGRPRCWRRCAAPDRPKARPQLGRSDPWGSKPKRMESNGMIQGQRRNPQVTRSRLLQQASDLFQAQLRCLWRSGRLAVWRPNRSRRLRKPKSVREKGSEGHPKSRKSQLSLKEPIILRCSMASLSEGSTQMTKMERRPILARKLHFWGEDPAFSVGLEMQVQVHQPFGLRGCQSRPC